MINVCWREQNDKVYSDEKDEPQVSQMLRAKYHWGLHIGMASKTYPEYSSLWRPVSTCTESGRLMMIPETDRAYIAGLFDGEGSIHFKRGIEKKKKHKGEGRLSIFKLYAYQYGNNYDRLFCISLGPRNAGCWDA